MHGVADRQAWEANRQEMEKPAFSRAWNCVLPIKVVPENFS
jgi:hypothetical protein